MDKLDYLYKEFFYAVIDSGLEISREASGIATQILANSNDANRFDTAPSVDALAKELADSDGVSTSRLHNILFEYEGCIEDEKFIKLMKPLCKGKYFSFSKYEASAKSVKFWILVEGFLNKWNWTDLIYSGKCSKKQCKKLLSLYQNKCKKIPERDLFAIYKALKNRRSY